MQPIKQTLANMTPPLVWNAWRAINHHVIRQSPSFVSPRHHASVLRLRALKDAYVGQRCFLIGNGPSLRQMDLQPLRHEYTFGLNRIYLLFAELGFTTTFLVSVNTHVIEQFGRDIAAIPIPRFIEWGARNFIPFDDRTILLRSLLFPAFSTDPTRGIWQGATVTYVAMQLAFYMGFNPVILIGVDHSFVTQGDPHKLVVSQGDDPNHFAANYFGKGTRWQLPDLETSEIAYHLARDTYTRHQRRILDATVGGQLMVFPKVAYESLF